MTAMQTFQTNYAVATGEYITEWCEDTGTTIADLAGTTGVPVGQLGEISLGERVLDWATAEAIEAATAILRAEHLIRFEAQHQADLERLFTVPCRRPGAHTGHRYRVESAIHWCPGPEPLP
jgi:hypothetical protein